MREAIKCELAMILSLLLSLMVDMLGYDSAEEMKNIKKFLTPYKPIKVELLPYHKMGEHNYDALGMDMTSFIVPTKEKMKELNKIFE